MNATIRVLLAAALLLFWSNAFGQNGISLQDCYRLAEANTAIAQSPQLFEKMSALKLENIEASRLPTMQWNARATWQNEVFGLPFEPPGVDISIPHYSITTNLEANYVLLDGGYAEARKTIEQAKLAVDNQSVVVELNKLKEQVDQYFFGALLLQEQTKSLDVTGKDLEAKTTQLEAAVRHGVALESEVLKLKVEQLRLRSKIEEAQSDRRALLAVLGSLTGQALDENTNLERPASQSPITLPTGQAGSHPASPAGRQSLRPELALFDLQKQQVLASSDLIDANWKPKLSTFVSAGVGYPDPLNFFDEKISPYVVAGVQFNWKLLDWQQADREREILSVQAQLIENQRQTFTQNLQHLDGKFREDVAKLQNQILRDEEIAKLQAEILRQLSSQLENGVATATDYLLQSDAELQARLAMEAHRVQLAQVEAAWRTWLGF